MEEYHIAWLAGHPDRSEAWLREKLAEGFDVHHLDGDHFNNDFNNLVLVYHADHMRMHGLGMRRKRPDEYSRLAKRLNDSLYKLDNPQSISKKQKFKQLVVSLEVIPGYRERILRLVEETEGLADRDDTIIALMRFPEYKERLDILIAKRRAAITEALDNLSKHKVTKL